MGPDAFQTQRANRAALFIKTMNTIHEEKWWMGWLVDGWLMMVLDVASIVGAIGVHLTQRYEGNRMKFHEFRA